GNTGSGGGGFGGAPFNDISGSMTITDSVFTRNRALGGAGGNGTDKAHGGAGGKAAGGAILPQRGLLVVQRSTFVENRASGGAGGASEVQGGNGGRGKGGAIHLPGFPGRFPSNEELVADLEDVTFLRNQVSGGDGGDGGPGTGGNGYRA